MKMRAVLVGFLAIGLFGFSGCGGGSAPAPKKEEKKTSQVTSPINFEVLASEVRSA